MGLLSLVRNVYDLDTLDTRFTSSTSVPYQTTIDARSDPAASKESSKKVQGATQPPKWHTLEFKYHYVIIAYAVVSMFWVAYGVSTRRKPWCHRQHHRVRLTST